MCSKNEGIKISNETKSRTNEITDDAPAKRLLFPSRITCAVLEDVYDCMCMCEGDVASFMRRVCGINLRKDGDVYDGYVGGVGISLAKQKDRIHLHGFSNAGLPLSCQQWTITQDFLAFSVTEFLCARFKCNAKIYGQDRLIHEVYFNPKYDRSSRNVDERACVFKQDQPSLVHATKLNREFSLVEEE